MSEDKAIEFYGFSPVARDPDVLFKDHPTASGSTPKQDPFQFADIPLPDSQLVQTVKAFVKVSYTTYFGRKFAEKCTRDI